ncbi:MAG: oligosaccharide flippase family protein [Flavobacteriaceae bacterium]|nr:oligosaccharide flippase family protein [Flavobacteriaceae bacterium]CAI8351277.1 MAG: Lipid III flippase [Flavobacteriaceae bacterium]
MNFIKTSIYSAASTTISLLVKLITNKVIALYLGTNGMFLMGQLKDFLKIGNTLGTMGIETGTVKYTSELNNKEKDFKDLVSTSFKIHLYSSLIIIGLILIFYNYLTLSLSKEVSEMNNYLFKYLLCFSIVSFSIQTFIMSVLNGLKKIKIFILINIIATIISGGVLIFLVINYFTIGAYYALILSPIITLITALVICMFLKPFKLNFLSSVFKIEHFKNLSNFSLMAIMAPICLVGATFTVRFYIYDEFDSNHAGSWEAMWRISAIYLLFLTTTFKFYLVPTFTNLENNNLKKEVFKIWKTTLPIIIIITLGVYISKDLIIDILFTSEFNLVNSLILFHLLGDIIKINCWVLGNVLVAKAKTKHFILFQVEWSVVFVILSIILANIYGFVGLSIAYFTTYIIHFLLLNIYFRKLLWKNN